MKNKTMTADAGRRSDDLYTRAQVNVEVMIRRFGQLQDHVVRNIGYGRGHSAELCRFWERVAHEMTDVGASTLRDLPRSSLINLELERQLISLS